MNDKYEKRRGLMQTLPADNVNTIMKYGGKKKVEKVNDIEK